jgi:hypothetical protein
MGGSKSLKPMREVIMKYISLLAAIFLLVSFGGCTLINSAPRHSADEVAAIAKIFSPTCQKLIPTAPGATHG